jgi:hypothetical protein
MERDGGEFDALGLKPLQKFRGKMQARRRSGYRSFTGRVHGLVAFRIGPGGLPFDIGRKRCFADPGKEFSDVVDAVKTNRPRAVEAFVDEFSFNVRSNAQSFPR